MILLYILLDALTKTAIWNIRPRRVLQTFRTQFSLMQWLQRFLFLWPKNYWRNPTGKLQAADTAQKDINHSVCSRGVKEDKRN